MIVDILMDRNHMTKYWLSRSSGIPHATLNDICSGKTKIEKCTAETIYRLAQALNVSMEQLVETGIRQ